MFESSKFLHTVIETMQEALMVVDTEGEIVLVNRALEDLTGYRREEMIGSSCGILECDVCLRLRASSKEKFCGLFHEGGIRRQKCELKRKDRTPLYVLKNAALLTGKDGEVLGGVETLTDLSDVVARDREIFDLRREMGLEKGVYGILGRSSAMVRLFDLVQSAAQSEAPILILGESGTGKELVAKAVHQLGGRSSGPFITVNCAALNDSLLESELFGHIKGAFTGADRNRIGRFEAAHGGDIFLDEIGDLPLSTQIKLLRVLQEKVIERVGEQKPIPVDVRIISATNRDLKALMDEERFREDLFYRIGVIPIRIPPLRERREDIPLLVDALIKRIALRSKKKVLGIEQNALAALIEFPWPGNVRELINAIEYAFVLCRGETIQIDHLPMEMALSGNECGPGPVSSAVAQVEGRKKEILEALERSGGKKTEAARLMGISRVTLWKRMKQLGLKV